MPLTNFTTIIMLYTVKPLCSGHYDERRQPAKKGNNITQIAVGNLFVYIQLSKFSAQN